ncbi:hypothetical protein D3C73_1390550 [compost metagenome]
MNSKFFVGGNTYGDSLCWRRLCFALNLATSLATSMAFNARLFSMTRRASRVFVRSSIL